MLTVPFVSQGELAKWVTVAEGVSQVHVALQPSPSTVFPSSHVSPESSTPFPQVTGVGVGVGGKGHGYATDIHAGLHASHDAIHPGILHVKLSSTVQAPVEDDVGAGQTGSNPVQFPKHIDSVGEGVGVGEGLSDGRPTHTPPGQSTSDVHADPIFEPPLHVA